MAIIPFLSIMAVLFRRIARKLSRDWRISISKLNESFAENISGISVARSFGREQSAREEFDDLN
jgi:ATP-binding cassette subfamily B protein